MSKALKVIMGYVLLPLITSTLVAIGAYLYLNRTPGIAIEIVTNDSAFDVKDDTTKLDVIYDGKSIKASGETLRVITFRVKNDGSAALKKDDYINPVGIRLEGVRLIETPIVIDASTNTLRSTASPTMKGNIVTIAPIVFRPNEFVEIKVRGLSQLNHQVEPTVVGEIATATDIPLISLPKSPPSNSFWSQVFAGGPLIHFSRAAILAIVILVIVVLKAAYKKLMIRRHVSKKQAERKRITEEYRKEPSFTPCEITEQMLKHFINNPLLVKYAYDVLSRKRIGQKQLERGVAYTLDHLVAEAVIDGKKKFVLKDEARQIYNDFGDYIEEHGYAGLRSKQVQMATKGGRITTVTSKDRREDNDRSQKQNVKQLPAMQVVEKEVTSEVNDA